MGVISSSGGKDWIMLVIDCTSLLFSESLGQISMRKRSLGRTDTTQTYGYIVHSRMQLTKHIDMQGKRFAISIADVSQSVCCMQTKLRIFQSGDNVVEGR